MKNFEVFRIWGSRVKGVGPEIQGLKLVKWDPL